MFEGLPTRSVTLGALFSGAGSFVVPYFQRPYSWTRKEAGILLENLVTAAGMGLTLPVSDYFLGTILLLERKDLANSANGSVFGIVDGQQRITTFAILAAVTRDLLDEASPGSATAARLDALLDGRGAGGGRRYRLELGGREQQTLETLVLQRRGCWEMPSEDSATPAEAAILEVREHFLEELKPLDPQDLQRLADYICDNCHVVAIHTGDLDRAHRLFMVLNGRGKPLQRNDILKAEMLGEVSGDAAGAVLGAWLRAAELTGEEFEALFSHIRVIHGKTTPAIISAIREIVADVGGPQRFVETELLPLAEAYALILGASKKDSAIKDQATRNRLIYLSRLNGHDWMPAALLAMKSYAQNPAGSAEIIAEIDRLAHILRLQCLGGNKRSPRFAALVRSLLAGDLEGARKGPLAITRDQVRSVHFYLRDFHVRNPAMCKMLLLRLSDEIDGKLTPVEPTDWSVEHVLPSRPSASSDWRQLFPNAEERDACTKSLGNLVLVSQKQNLSAKNGTLARKQEIYRTPDAGMPILRLTEDAITAKSWTPDDVRAREERLLAVLAKTWNLDLAGAAVRSNGQRKFAE